MLKIVKGVLFREGVTPGARGHKKITYPKGTEVFYIKYRSLYFHSCYLNWWQADDCLKGLEASTKPEAKGHIPLQTLVAWNFSSSMPVKVTRQKEEKSHA